MDIFVRVFLYILFFVSGALCVHKKFVKQKLSETFLYWIFYIGLPISVFYAITSTKIELDLLVLPFISALISTIGGLIAIVVGMALQLPKKILGVIVASSMIMNTALTVPFFAAFYGPKGLAVISLFDLGNLLMIFTFVYFITLKIGGVTFTPRVLIERILKMPALWSIVVSLALAFFGFQLPHTAQLAFSWVTVGIFLLVMFTLGMMFEFNFSHFSLIALGLSLRIIVGFIIGTFFVNLLDLEGLYRVAVLVGAASPNGYTSLVYAKIAKLDTRFGGQLISISLGLGIIFIPLMLLLIK